MSTPYPVLAFIESEVFLKEDFEIEDIIIPKGFPFNGHSTPKALYSIFGGRYEPSYIVAALVHDWMYYIREDRKYSDRVYLNLLRSKKCRYATLFYWAVRLFGWYRYNSDPREMLEY